MRMDDNGREAKGIWQQVAGMHSLQVVNILN